MWRESRNDRGTGVSPVYGPQARCGSRSSPPAKATCSVAARRHGSASRTRAGRPCHGGSEAAAAGFTLVELLVVIGIIAVLVGILLPAISRARGAARNAGALAEIRQVQAAYVMYAEAHRGTLLPGFLPDRVRGEVPTAADPVSGQQFTGRAARQWPARMAEFVGAKGNLYRLIRPTLGTADLPRPGDDATATEVKAYSAGLYSRFGLNTVFLGGHGVTTGSTDFFRGFNADGSNRTGGHVAFKITDVRRPSEQVVFVEVGIANGSQSVDATDRLGLHFASPPRADAASGLYWRVDGRGRAVSALPATPRRTLGLPFARASGTQVGGRVPVSFLDGRAELLTPSELTDMRRWAPRATSADYSF